MQQKQRSPCRPVTAHCTLWPPTSWLQLLFYPEVSFYFSSNLSSEKSGIKTLPLSFFSLHVVFKMNNFLVGDLKPLCKILCETSSLPTAWGNRAASSSREIPVVCFEDTGGRGHLRDDQEGLFWLLARGTLGIPHLLWQAHLHGHREAELSAASLLRNGSTVGIASRARMSYLSSKPAQPLLPSCWARCVFCLGWVFTCPHSYCLVGFSPLSCGWYTTLLPRGNLLCSCLNPVVFFSILCV